NHGGLGSAIRANAGSGLQRGAASNRNNATSARLPQRGDRDPQNVKYRIQIEIKHFLKSSSSVSAIGWPPANPPTVCARTSSLPKRCDNLIHQDLGALASRNVCWNRSEAGVVEIRWLYLS